jgi:Glycosyltransferase family 87
MRSAETADRTPATGSGVPGTRDSLYLYLLGCGIFLLVGLYTWEGLSSSSMADFRSPYTSARCLIRHCDPYNPNDLLRLYLAEGGARPTDSRDVRRQVMYGEYPPGALIFFLFFALFPAGFAQTLWGAFIAVCFLLASFLIWREAAASAPAVAGCLICFLTASSGLLLGVGNPSGVAISLCAVGAWSLLKEQCVALGIFSLAASLSLKPHDAGLVWLYFLLAGGSYRRRALQTLALTAAINLPAILWVAHLSPHWMQEILSNIQVLMAHGAMNDPGPTSSGARGIEMMVNLQTVFAFFSDHPRFYNLATCCLWAPLFLIWFLVTVRSRPSRTTAWLGLAAIAPLSLLPLYHRQYDAKLLLLTVPACTILCSERSRTGLYALLITATALVFNGDFTWISLINLVPWWHLIHMRYFDPLAFPVPLSLLATGSFYLWIYARHGGKQTQPTEADPLPFPAAPFEEPRFDPFGARIEPQSAEAAVRTGLIA